MLLKSPITDIQQFHRVINKTFHDVEAQYYDDIHQEMWKSLPVQFKLLVDDLLQKKTIAASAKIKMLDVGCGTGLATHLLLQTPIADNIIDITLLDTSPAMLQYATKRALKWKIKPRLHEGELNTIDETFDLILISSVLHHIPDLHLFLAEIKKKLNPGGILLTIHDPLNEAISSTAYNDRCNEYFQLSRKKRSHIIQRLYHGIKRRILPAKNADYIEQANEILLKENIIHSPLTAVEIWSITDIHVEGLPYSHQPGISIKWLEGALSDFELVNYRTYCFFGLLASNLKYGYQDKEKHLYLANDKNGRNFGSVWIKKQSPISN